MCAVQACKQRWSPILRRFDRKRSNHPTRSTFAEAGVLALDGRSLSEACCDTRERFFRRSYTATPSSLRGASPERRCGHAQAQPLLFAGSRSAFASVPLAEPHDLSSEREGDKSPDKVAEEYKHNLPDFIRSLRDEFGKPELPFVIATTGMGQKSNETSPPPYENYHAVERAQLWAVGVEKPSKVLTDDTRGYNEAIENSPRNQGHHWNGNARSYFRIGLEMGNDMVKLLKP